MSSGMAFQCRRKFRAKCLLVGGSYGTSAGIGGIRSIFRGSTWAVFSELWKNSHRLRRRVVRYLIASRRSEVERICQRWGVRRFELFGSATREDFSPTSDLDFLVEFESGGSLESYLGLRNDLEELFGRAVDLVMPTAIRNPYVRAAIDRDRQLVYAA